MKKGFTLLELIAAVSVIVVLAMLLLPALGGMQKRAEEVRSTQTLRQLTAARLLQMGERDGKATLSGWRRDILPYLGQGKAGNQLTQWQDPKALRYFQCKI
jgi:prepilin-type N-terminal cleavage/methylation domain-containing protein